MTPLVFVTLALLTTVEDSGRPRIRIWSPAHGLDGRPATLLSASRESLAVVVEGQPGPLLLPPDTVTKVQLSRGKRRTAGRAAVYGLLAGAVVGLVAYGPSDGQHCCSPLVFAGAAGAAGAGVGAIVGTLTKRERWEDVEIDRLRAGSSARPAPHRGISFALRF